MAQRIVFGTGALGLAAFWFSRWSRRTRARLEANAIRRIGELR